MTAETRVRTIARLAGPLGAAVALCAIALAASVSSTFSWTTSALSDLGGAPETALLFNGGLVVGGLLALGYAAALRESSTAVAVGYACCSVSLALVGAFPVGTRLHLPAAVAFFAFLAATLGIDGVRRRDAPDGRRALALCAVSIAAWPLWAVSDLGPGIAVPELVGALALATWIVAVAPPAPLR